MDSTRRHPRTLAEAFPKSPEYACAIERPAADRSTSVDWWVTAACLAALVGLVWAVNS